MKIKIVDPMRGFSHNPGHEVMLPGTAVAIKAFPTRIECRDLLLGKEAVFSWTMKRSIHPFTVEQDLEKKQILIYGEADSGYFRLRIDVEEANVYLTVEKAPVEKTSLSKGDKILLMEGIAEEKTPFIERLFLGCNKQKNMDRMRERVSLAEILPYWFYLGQITPKVEITEGALLNHLRKGLWQELYMAGFSSGFVPRAIDEQFQGIIKEESENPKNPLFLLGEGAVEIRSMFFQEQEQKYFFLPNLPSKLVSGRIVGIRTAKGHRIDIEWTKGKLRKIYLEIEGEDTIQPIFPKEIKECRLRRKKNEKGEKLHSQDRITVQAKEKIWIDLFQK